MFSVHSRKARKTDNIEKVGEESRSEENTVVTHEKKCCDHECKSQTAADTSSKTDSSDDQQSNSPHAASQNSPYTYKPQKDFWDKVAALAPAISGLLIFGAGWLFTYAYNEQQLRLQEVQTIEKFIPHLMGSEPSKKAAILAISSLTNPELAARFASIFASSGTVSALQSIAESGDQHEKKVATKALAIALENLEVRDSKISDLQNAYRSLQDKATQQDTQFGLPPLQQSEGLTPARLDKLAQAYKAIGQFTQAEPLLKESLTLREKAYGSQHPEVAASARRLAEIYQLLGNQDLADDMIKKAKDIETKLPDSKSPVAPSTAPNADPVNQTDTKKDQVEQKGDSGAAEKESMLEIEPVDSPM